MQLPCLVLLFALIPLPLLAQSNDHKIQQLIVELNTLIDQAEKERAASYHFIDQLRDLTARYDSPAG